MKPQDGDSRVVKVEVGSFADLVHAFYASDKFKNLALSTQQKYRHYLTIAAEPEILGAEMVDQLTVPKIQQFLDGLAHMPGAQEQAKVAIKSMEKWALPRGFMRFPITYGTEVIGSDGNYEPWTDDEVELALEYARPDLARVILLAAETGQRGSDLVKMQWSHLEKVEGLLGINVTQQKTAVQLWVPITPKLEARAKNWDRSKGFLLLRADATPWPARHNVSVAWDDEKGRNPRLRAVQSKVIHGLRGYKVVKLRREGLSPLQIADMVGMSVPMIERYCKLSDKKKSAVAAVHFLNANKRRFVDRKSGNDGS